MSNSFTFILTVGLRMKLPIIRKSKNIKKYVDKMVFFRILYIGLT
ncbi:hypothetical protein TPHV1_70079 [Treponema phagedenis]|uniref:Uncharacterized protein n=1 Tax=Treponema phagedenis TaxID=162 RepID=A0A0B7H2M3_TREPH|nr:hypothetical protein TPHV1_70079 [Treponema phagedenis]